MAQSVVAGAPLSEPAQKITAPETVEGDLEKEGEVRVETAEAQVVVVHQEDEPFEWREIIRGKFAVGYRCALLTAAVGCLDIQVWLTAFAYMGIIVSLYSYSLFR